MEILDKYHNLLVKQTKRLLKRITNLEILNKEQTIAYLNDYLIADGRELRVELPEVVDASEKNKILFPAHEALSSRNYVWRYEGDFLKNSLLRIGSICIDHKVLKTDFGYAMLSYANFGGRKAIQDFLKFKQRYTFQAKTLIAPWSHYFRKEYYVYMMFIAAKLCRIKDVLSPQKFNEALLAYPLYNTSYEKDVLNLLGFQEGQVFDSQVNNIKFESCFIGNNDNWWYPNLADILSLKRNIEPQVSTDGYTGSERIYISRNGRRSVINESQLIKLLERYGFEVIEDKPRSLAEQIRLYKNASFVIGPHGASFTNIIWCKPGTHLFELFPPDYLSEFFLYLSQILGLKYSAYCYGEVRRNVYKADSDVYVSIPEIEKCLNELL